MRTLVPVVSVALVLGACTESLAPSPDEGSVPSTPATSASPLTTVAEFVGAYDPTTGELTIEPLPVEEWRFADHGAHRMVRQGGVIENAHGYCNDLPLGRNGVRLNTVNGSLGLTVADCIPEPGRSFWGSFVYTDGAFCATVRLTNDTGKRLYNPVAEIIEITSGYEAYQYIDTGSDPPCCGTGADVAALPTGPRRPVDITGGVFQWTDVNTGASADQKWTFRNGGGPLRFRGRVVAQIHEIDNGLDDDCDGVVDNLLGEFPDGAACRVDRDCESGVCSSGVCGISCGPGTYGPACDACVDCGPHGACDEGATGTGACMCDPGYAGGACDDCSNGRFGPSCELCPSCGVNGACDEGIAGGGTCVCDVGFHGAECQYSCSNGIQDGDEEDVDCGGSCVATSGVAQLALGAAHTCVRFEDSTVKCWGNNAYGNLGRGDNSQTGDTPGEMGVLWMSITGAVASPFVPLRVGVDDVPPEYKQHRYMTKAADWAFLDTDYAPLEATRSAFRVHKRLLYYTCAHPEVFLDPVTATLEAFEARELAEQTDLERRAAALYAAGSPDSARALITSYSRDRLMAGLALGEALVEQVERTTVARFGIPMPQVEVPEGASWRPESAEMRQRPGQTYHRCLMEERADEYPRRHGTLASQAQDTLVSRVLGRR